jgi:TonB family protein
MDYTMRKVIVAAALSMSPMLLHAQATSPAPTQTSALVQPKAFNSSAAENAAAVPTNQPLRISTGVTAPKLISTVSIVENERIPATLRAADQLAVVSMIVNADGKPSDLKIVRSVGAAMDVNVLSAVSQYRFAPGTLDHQPTAIPLTLEITLRHSTL